MALKGKHNIVEIEGVRCSVVETGLSEERVAFLKELLETNGFQVKSEIEKKKKETDPTTYVVGVTDILFNAMIWLYQKRLRTKDKKPISPAYWNQWKNVDTTIPYYMVER